MTCTPIQVRGMSGIICTTPGFKPGDQAPKGYLEWQEWAEVQHKAGLRQKQCGRCGKWKYPQELSATVDRAERTGLRKRKPFRDAVETPVCNDCEAATAQVTPNAKSTSSDAEHSVD